MLNRELFVEDPIATIVPNLGVAKVQIPESAEELAILKWELSHFVCEGEYAAGLQRMLESYIRNLDKDAQPACWVSGFYGSGKSHLVRVLQYLWTDYRFDDGSSAQGLVALPSAVKDPLKELEAFARREGGVWAAAGTLGAGAGDSVRLAFLGIILRAAGLPEKVEPAQFVLWLHREGLKGQVRSGVEASGKVWAKELRNFYVSPAIAESLLAAQPAFATSAAEAKALLRTQFPPVKDVTDDEFLEVLRGVLEMQSTKPGRLPATLVVLDELQQYINDDVHRMLAVQGVIEACCTKFDSRLLVVATGQSALQATPVLQKLQDRYAVRVPLADADIDSVVRRVVLQKRQDKVGALRDKLDQVSGEISRHLGGSKIQPVAADDVDLVPLYPLLPTRRRFWERVLRAIDPGGTAGQLRTQLQTIHEANRAVGLASLGVVVPGDFIYDQQSAGMLETGVMSRETYDEIALLRDGTEEGALRSRIAALVFLLSKLPTDPGSDLGLRADPDTLADLLVEDLSAASADLRKRVTTALEGMAKEGKLNEVGGEYRLLTKESANWQAEYLKRLRSLQADAGRIASERDAELKRAVSEILRRVSLVHGKSKTARKLQVSYGQMPPIDDKTSIPIWVRDGWESTEKTARDDAVKAGVDDPQVTLFIPRQEDAALQKVIAEWAAAEDTVSGRPIPTTSEGREARAGMETRKAASAARFSSLIAQVIRNTKVFQGGGNEIAAASLEESVSTASSAAIDRRFPQFGIADHPEWGKVVQRARDGSAEPLAPVGDTGEVIQNPVCKEILQYLPGSWVKGAEVRGRFAETPYGWPQDAVDGALVALVGAGALSARLNGQDVAVKELNPGSVSKTEFRKEITTVTAAMRVAVRGLMVEMGINVGHGEEGPNLPAYLDRLVALAESAGGDAPLPERPDTTELKRIRNLSGNDLIAAVHGISDQIKGWVPLWRRDGELARTRLEAWLRLQDLLRFARDTPFAVEPAQQSEAIKAGRRLLDEPDPVGPIAAALCAGFRVELGDAYGLYEGAVARGNEQLAADPRWGELDESKRAEILAAVRFTPVPAPALGSEDDILASLRESSIAEWKDRADAIAAKVAEARERAVRVTEPTAQRFVAPPAHLSSAEDVDRYVAALRDELLRRLGDGPVVI